MSLCPDFDQLRRYLAGSSGADDAVETHVENCPECERRLAALSGSPLDEVVVAVVAQESSYKGVNGLLPGSTGSEPLSFGPAVPGAPLGRLGSYSVLLEIGV